MKYFFNKNSSSIKYYSVLSWFGLDFENIGITLIARIVVVLLQIVNYILGGILWVVGWVFDWALKLSTQSNNVVVEAGWNTSLQIANMFFMLLLLAIGIATILQIETLNWKKALPRLILVALLINFSMVIGSVIIYFTNTIALFFSGQISSPEVSVSKMLATAMKVNLRNGLSAKMADTALLNDIAKNIVNIAIFSFLQIYVQVIAIFVMTAGAVYMISRTFWLWLLLMLAPLAWIAYAMPTLEKHWKKWWEKFLCWCFFAPAFLFFMYLALMVFQKAAAISINTGTSGETWSEIISAGKIIQITLVAFIMIFGIIAGKSVACGGGNFVMNYGNKLKDATSKRFKELRSKSPLSAEKLGAKFGGMGAGMLAKTRIGRMAGYKEETLEALELDKLKKEQAKLNLLTLREKLKETKHGEDRKYINEKGEEVIIKGRLSLLSEIRAITAGKGKLEQIEEILGVKKEGGGPKEKAPKKEGDIKASAAPAPKGEAPHH